MNLTYWAHPGHQHPDQEDTRPASQTPPGAPATTLTLRMALLCSVVSEALGLSEASVLIAQGAGLLRGGACEHGVHAAESGTAQLRAGVTGPDSWLCPSCCVTLFSFLYLSAP